MSDCRVVENINQLSNRIPESNNLLDPSLHLVRQSLSPIDWYLQLAIMGQGGHVVLVNGTPYNWQRTGQHSYQMNTWSFPDFIPAVTCIDVYVEWYQFIFPHQRDDAGEAEYTLTGTDSKFELQARSGDTFNIQVYLKNITTQNNGQGSIIPLGWNHDGCVYFILSGTRATSYRTILLWIGCTPTSARSAIALCVTSACLAPTTPGWASKQAVLPLELRTSPSPKACQLVTNFLLEHDGSTRWLCVWIT